VHYYIYGAYQPTITVTCDEECVVKLGLKGEKYTINSEDSITLTEYLGVDALSQLFAYEREFNYSESEDGVHVFPDPEELFNLEGMEIRTIELNFGGKIYTYEFPDKAEAVLVPYGGCITPKGSAYSYSDDDVVYNGEVVIVMYDVLRGTFGLDAGLDDADKVPLLCKDGVWYTFSDPKEYVDYLKLRYLPVKEEQFISLLNVGYPEAVHPDIPDVVDNVVVIKKAIEKLGEDECKEMAEWAEGYVALVNVAYYNEGPTQEYKCVVTDGNYFQNPDYLFCYFVEGQEKTEVPLYRKIYKLGNSFWYYPSEEEVPSYYLQAAECRKSNNVSEEDIYGGYGIRSPSDIKELGEVLEELDYGTKWLFVSKQASSTYDVCEEEDKCVGTVVLPSDLVVPRDGYEELLLPEEKVPVVKEDGSVEWINLWGGYILKSGDEVVWHDTYRKYRLTFSKVAESGDYALYRSYIVNEVPWINEIYLGKETEPLETYLAFRVGDRAYVAVYEKGKTDWPDELYIYSSRLSGGKWGGVSGDFPQRPEDLVVGEHDVYLALADVGVSGQEIIGMNDSVWYCTEGYCVWEETENSTIEVVLTGGKLRKGYYLLPEEFWFYEIVDTYEDEGYSRYILLPMNYPIEDFYDIAGRCAVEWTLVAVPVTDKVSVPMIKGEVKNCPGVVMTAFETISIRDLYNLETKCSLAPYEVSFGPTTQSKTLYLPLAAAARGGIIRFVVEYNIIPAFGQVDKTYVYNIFIFTAKNSSPETLPIEISNNDEITYSLADNCEVTAVPIDNTTIKLIIPGTPQTDYVTEPYTAVLAWESDPDSSDLFVFTIIKIQNGVTIKGCSLGDWWINKPEPPVVEIPIVENDKYSVCKINVSSKNDNYSEDYSGIPDMSV